MEFENSNVMFYLRGKYITNLFESFSSLDSICDFARIHGYDKIRVIKDELIYECIINNKNYTKWKKKI